MNEIYSEVILDLYKNPLNYGELKEFNVKAQGGNPSCGDLIVFTIQIENRKIKDIKFKGHGCAISTAAASLLTEEIKGKKLKEIKKLKEKHLIEMLGGIIQTRIKCATLGKKILDKAITEWEKKDKRKKKIKVTIRT
jgi:nitrogen fixation NifU-like protein